MLLPVNGAIPFLKAWKKRLLVVATPILLLPLPFAYGGTQESKCAYVVLLMAVYWMTESIPLPITGLIPIVFLPMLGILDTTEACSAYMNEAIMIGIGSILVAIAVERCNLHQRIALFVLTKVGTTPKRLLAGFMATSALLSMWIGPTPVVAMMVPIVQAVLKQLNTLEDQNAKPLEDILPSVSDSIEQYQSTEENEVIISVDKSEEGQKDLMKKVLVLGICFAANVGGSGTIPATAPNLVFKTVIEKAYPKYGGMTFTSWLLFNLPGLVLNVMILWLFLVLMYVKKIKSQRDKSELRAFLKEKYSELGKMSFHEGSVFALFLLLAVLWLFRDPEFIPGWEKLMPGPAKVTDATSTLAVASLLFIIPSTPTLHIKSPSLLEWNVAQEKMPWGVFILLGGGFSLAEGAKKSGFSRWLGESLAKLDVLPVIAVSLILCIIILVLIEVSGNTATATVVFPVLASVADLAKINPLYILLPAAVSSSYAFMFPVSSAPNAIVFENFKVKIRDMALPGLVAKFICLSVITLMTNTLGKAMFDLDSFPSWAHKMNPTEQIAIPTTEMTTL